MATSNLPPENSEDRDSFYNPGEQLNREKFESFLSHDTQNLDANRENPSDASSAVKNAEEEVSKGAAEAPVRHRRGKRKLSFKGFMKKKSTIAGLITLLLGGGGAFSLILAPGIGIVQLKEIFTDDLNDQLAAYDLRSTAMWKAKLKGIQGSASVCSDLVKIRCQYRSMSEKSIKRFESEFKKVGYEVKYDKISNSRYRVTEIIRPGGTPLSDPADVMNNLGDKNVRTALTRVHNPIFASLKDHVANSVLKNRFFTSKAEKLKGNTTEELEESMKDNTTGELPDGQRAPLVDENGNTYLLDENGDRVYQNGPLANPDEYDRLKAELDAKLASFDQNAQAGTKAVSGVLSGALKGVSVLGIADSACSIYNLSLAVAAAAKVARAVQLAQYAMVFNTTADQLKAGEARPEQTEFLGNIITAVDTRQMITDELSEVPAGTSIEEAQTLAENGQLMRENPDYGKNGFDSDGYKISAYNEAPNLSARSQQFAVGGGLAGSMSSVNATIAEAVGGDNIRESCNVIQNFWTRAAGLTIGVIAAIGSAGLFTLISVGGSLALAMAAPFLEAMLVDIVTGKVTEGISGVDAINAHHVGTGVTLGGIAQARGLKPLTESELQPYLALSNEVQADYAQIAREEAKDEPFNVMNQYSFLGSFARTFNIPISKASTSVASAVSSVPSILASSFASLIPNAGAQYGYNPDRFRKCNDEGYKALGISADVFCNVRYGLTSEDLGMDPMEVMEYMLDEGHINNDGVPISGSIYLKFLENCVSREDGWGETGEEQSDDWMTGLACMGTSDVVTEEQLRNFRVFTLDSGITYEINGDEPPEIPEGGAAGAAGSFSGDKRALAQKILAKNKVSFASYVRPKLEEIANGTNDGNSLPCGVNINILRIIDAITDKHSITISDINRQCTNTVPGGSSTKSRHYAGNGSAIDISVIDGVATSGRGPAAASVIALAMPILSQAATSVGSYSQVGQLQCGAAIPLMPGVSTFNDFCNHIHMDVPAWSDPALQYTPGGW